MCEEKEKQKTDTERQTEKYKQKRARARESFAPGKQTDTHNSLFRWEEEKLKQRRRNQCPCGTLEKKTWEGSCFCIPCEQIGRHAREEEEGEFAEEKQT
jgi:hypothetical protein